MLHHLDKVNMEIARMNDDFNESKESRDHSEREKASSRGLDENDHDSETLSSESSETSDQSELIVCPLQISCNQIDSNVFNVKRILRRFIISKKGKGKNNIFYWESQNIIYQKIDSQNNFLTFEINPLQKDVIFKDENSNNGIVYITLALKDFPVV